MSQPRPLAGVRVLDFTWVRAGPWATRWLGVLGAEVIKVEWPENLTPGRRQKVTTIEEIHSRRNASGAFADASVHKLSLTINVRTPKGLELIKQLLAISDIVIENFRAGVMDRWGIGYQEMQRLRPDIIYVSLSGFGHTGPYHSYTTIGPSAQAVSGLTFLSGLPGKPPAGWGWSYLDDTGGLYGAMSALTALRHRNATGQGQHVDLSQMITGIPLIGPAFLDHTVNGRPARREGYPPGNRTVWPGTPVVNNYRGPITAPHNAYRTQGGGYNDWCTIACFSAQEWQNLVRLMGGPAWATDARFSTLKGRIQHQEELDQGIEAWSQTLDKYALTEQCQAAGVQAMPVQSPEDRVENDPQLRARGMYTELDHPVLGRRKFQSTPFKLSRSSVEVQQLSPLLGQHNQEVLEGLLGLSHQELLVGYQDGTFWPREMPLYPYIQEALSTPLKPLTAETSPSEGPTMSRLVEPPRRTQQSSDGPPGPLASLRVLELADEKGQFCGKLLADLGADVVKIEPPGGQNTRSVGPFLEDLPHPERSLSFWHYNTSKRGITLDLETEDGRGLFRSLVATADVVLESYPPGYLSSLGLGHENLAPLNPRLIMCSLTPFGQTGPWRDYQTCDLLHLAVGGQMACCGYDPEDVPDAPPIAPGGGNAWHMGAHYACIAILGAIYHRSRTGLGQYIDASIHEACALNTEGHVNVYIESGQVVRRHTGRHSTPAGSELTQFATKEGKWVNISRAIDLTPPMLRTLAEWMDGYGLAQDLFDERYQSIATILENSSHLSGVLANFFATMPQEEIWHGGQERGLPWGAIRSMDEIIDDLHLQDRGVLVEVEHPELGRRFTYPGHPAIYHGSPWRISRRAPLIGEHNGEILGGELGLSKEELSLLAESKVI